MRLRIWMSTISVSLTLVLWSLPAAVQAADINRQYGVRAYDKVESCYALNRAVNSAKNEDDWSALYGFSLYTMGYLTGVSRLAHDTYDIGGRKNTKTLMVWLEQYCLDNPDESFDSALSHLIAEMYPQRTIQAPN
ncbi:Uncharacterised protein [Halioglobus japonicus]|nr:Uncharacterised protein [Halioglobus japonicus]